MTLLELTEIDIKERELLNEIYKTLVDFASELSTCNSKKVATYLTNEQWGVIEINQGIYDCMRDGCTTDNIQSVKCEIEHAEVRAINHCKETGNDTAGATMYITHQPCDECAKKIVEAQIKTVCFWIPHVSSDSTSILENAGINVIHVRGGK